MRASMPQAGGGVALGVQVDHQDPVVLLGQGRSQVDGSRGLADPALLVGHGDHRGSGRGAPTPPVLTTSFSSGSGPRSFAGARSPPVGGGSFWADEGAAGSGAAWGAGSGLGAGGTGGAGWDRGGAGSGGTSRPGSATGSGLAAGTGVASASGPGSGVPGTGPGAEAGTASSGPGPGSSVGPSRSRRRSRTTTTPHGESAPAHPGGPSGSGQASLALFHGFLGPDMFPVKPPPKKGGPSGDERGVDVSRETRPEGGGEPASRSGDGPAGVGLGWGGVGSGDGDPVGVRRAVRTNRRSV